MCRAASPAYVELVDLTCPRRARPRMYPARVNRTGHCKSRSRRSRRAKIETRRVRCQRDIAGPRFLDEKCTVRPTPADQPRLNIAPRHRVHVDVGIAATGATLPY